MKDENIVKKKNQNHEDYRDQRKYRINIIGIKSFCESIEIHID